MTKAHLVKVIRMRDHEIAGLKRRVKAYEEADTIDQFKAAINRAREAEELLAQARKRDTMLDDMCNLIDERDILLAEKALLESERDAMKDKVEKLDGEANKLAWRVAELEQDLADHDLLAMKERIAELEAEGDIIVGVKQRNELRRQNALLVEGLKQIGSSSRCCEFALGAHEDKDKCHDIYANKADWCDYCVAKDALAAVKEMK